ncbi:restriction endonuclease subunit S [Vibrio fluvialis]|uniref:restriction endonuclease subunit S n=1 Tax=Vibrio fluvialis TaxID=676 RepID=UPI0023A9A976|nr:restriction endonuclease subunit S [Vibrio fluvialis]MDE5178901.1 restriction endonuclease subunit S [Vibrio fluvialis]
MTEQMNVPKLRFSEFEESWNSCTLGELVSVMTDYVASGSFEALRNNVKVYDEPNHAIYLRLTDLRRDIFGSQLKYVDAASYTFLEKSNLSGGELLIANIGANVGDVYLMPNIEQKATIAPNMIVMRENTLRFKSKFLIHSLKGFYGRKSINLAISGSGQPKLSKTDLKKVKVNIPTLPEQQKIASFLSKVDEKIGLLTEKKDKLTEYKKGVMQQLFNGKWENHNGQLTFIPPTLRFKADDGSEFPDWEEKKLGDLSRTIKSGKSKADDNGTIDLWGSTGKIGFTNEVSHDGNFILVARVGANAGKINEVQGQFGVSDNTLIIDVKPRQHLRFIKYSLLKFDLNRLIFGSGQPLITGGDLKSHKMVVPNFDEQTKIANFLSAIDQKIDLANSELEKAKEWKKGLLQQMFV